MFDLTAAKKHILMTLDRGCWALPDHLEKAARRRVRCATSEADIDDVFAWLRANEIDETDDVTPLEPTPVVECEPVTAAA